MALQAKIAQGEVGSFHANKVCNKPAVGKPLILGRVGLSVQAFCPERPLEMILLTLLVLVMP